MTSITRAKLSYFSPVIDRKFLSVVRLLFTLEANRSENGSLRVRHENYGVAPVLRR